MSVGIQAGNLYSCAVIYADITPSSVSANTTAEQYFSVPGVKQNDAILVNPPFNLGTGLGICGVRPSAASDQVGITFNNNTAGALTPIASRYVFVVFRQEGQRQVKTIEG